ncbi:MAG TPA: hypothetical protein VK158_02365 [Acidobacteriota bacterium]|nr:hypothetical protein [Acidobacteriota bacterium]
MKNEFRMLQAKMPFSRRASAKAFNRRRQYLEEILRAAPFDIIDHTGEYPQLLLTGIPRTNHTYQHVRTLGLFPLTSHEYTVAVHDTTCVGECHSSIGYMLVYKYLAKKNYQQLSIFVGPAALDIIR